MSCRAATGPIPPTSEIVTDRRFQMTPCVLVVDDEVNIVSLLAMFLEDEGFQVLRAYDGEQAWSMVLQHQPQLVITDLCMPNLGGIGLLRRMRSTHALSATPVIVMSAARHADDDELATFVPKPFDLDSLLVTVKEHLPVHCEPAG